jgi:hypothetical protein
MPKAKTQGSISPRGCRLIIMGIQYSALPAGVLNVWLPSLHSNPTGLITPRNISPVLYWHSYARRLKWELFIHKYYIRKLLTRLKCLTLETEFLRYLQFLELFAQNTVSERTQRWSRPSVCQLTCYNVEVMETVLKVLGVGGLQQSFRVYKLASVEISVAKYDSYFARGWNHAVWNLFVRTCKFCH